VEQSYNNSLICFTYYQKSSRKVAEAQDTIQAKQEVSNHFSHPTQK
jgi:hypothetical protein